MTEVIVELGYRPEIVQSPIDLGASIGGSTGAIPEPVAAALLEARVTGQLVFVDFHAQWCGACKTMHRTTFKDPEVEKVFERLILIKVDTDRYPDTAKYFDVVGLPTLVALNVRGEEVYRRVGPVGADQLAPRLSLLADKAEETRRGDAF
ncbi:MAG: thioredoxin domain-containing protein [Gammaproteobacteria bacterium]|nr:thioredoxin domain-containing protein [Gammaproteobacteria bacterium]